MASIISNAVGIFRFYKEPEPPKSPKVVLQRSFQEKIQANAYKIIARPNFACPAEVKRRFIEQHNLEPGKYEKILTKICKPTSKVVASFAVEWILAPVISGIFVAKMIVFFPSLAILGTSYWTTVSVALVSLAVYPVLKLTIGAIFKRAVTTYHIVADRIRLFILSRRNQQNHAPLLNAPINFETLTCAIRYDAATGHFMMSTGKKSPPEQINEYVVKSLFKKALKLEKYHVLLMGDRDAIQEAFRDTNNHLPADQSWASGVNINVSELKGRHKTQLGLQEIFENREIHFNQKHLINFGVKVCAKKAVQQKIDQLRAPQGGIIMVGVPFADSDDD